MGQTAFHAHQAVVRSASRSAAIAALLLALGACGGGGGGGGSSNLAPAVPPAKSPDRFWGYAGSETSAADTLALVTFDPDNLGAGVAPVAKRAALLGEPFAMPHGRYDGTDASVAEYREHTLVYASGNTLFKLSLSKGASATPLRVSAEAAAQRVCWRQEHTAQFFTQGAPDYSNHDLSSVVYRVPGADGLCDTNDDTWRAVKLGMSATDQPIEAGGEPIAALHDLANGALVGWLVVRAITVAGSAQVSYKLQRVDANFANAADIGTLKTPWRLAGRVPNQGAFAGDVLIAGGDELRRFDVRTSGLSAPLVLVVADARQLLVSADATHAYVVRSGFGVDEILKVPLDGSAPAQLWDSVPGPIWDLHVTNTHVFYRVWDGVLRSLTKDTLAPQVASLGVLTDGTETRASRSGDTLGLTGRTQPAGGQAEASFATLFKGDGTALINIDGAELLGDALPALRADGARGRVVLAHALAADGSGYLGFAGASIKSYDSVTGGGELTLGTLPRAGVEVSGLRAAAGYAQLVTLSAVAIDRATGARYFDLYLAETDKADALTRVTRNIP
jgi:hypothetical protein